MGWAERKRDTGQGGLASGKTPSFAYITVIRAPDLHTIIVLELASRQIRGLNFVNRLTRTFASEMSWKREKGRYKYEPLRVNQQMLNVIFGEGTHGDIWTR